jgi:hypothetical protein
MSRLANPADERIRRNTPSAIPTYASCAALRELRGAPVEVAPLSPIIARAIADLGLDLPGVTPTDLAHAIAGSRHIVR